MAIKPHLAVAMGLYTLISRRWSAAAAALAVVALTSALATLVFGSAVWGAWLVSLDEAGSFLAKGSYPLFRMVSGYAFARSFGLPVAVAAATQFVFTAVSLSAMTLASFRYSARQAIGFSALVSLAVSPYAFDYDLPVFGVGLAMLLPDLIRYGARGERAFLYVSMLAAQAAMCWVDYNVRSIVFDFGRLPPSFGAILVIVTIAMTKRILDRARVAPAAAKAAPALGLIEDGARRREAL